METAGFVLAGGRSSRMGRDKSLLELEGEALVERAARRVAAAAGSVALVGDAGRHAKFGWPVVVDLRPGQGPLGGIESALASPFAGQWNLIVACDLPELTAGFLRRLLDTAEASGCDALLPHTSGGRPQPLCAVYRRSARQALEERFRTGTRKVTLALEELVVHRLEVSEVLQFQNVNTPEDWADYAAG